MHTHTPHAASNQTLRHGWTTGTCATAAAKAAFIARVTGECPAQVCVTLPNGATPSFAVAWEEKTADGHSAGVIKDAGDDPDVTHGALILATVAPAPPGAGILFHAGPGVGHVTRPGLPLPVGEPAINPVPRQMIARALAEARAHVGGPADVAVTLAIPGGADLAQKTLNPRLGIIGGLSILGTTGIVVPFSCAAWIDTIHRGIDVARAMGLSHIAGATGRMSEEAVQNLYGLPEAALIDMGDFVGGMLKYLRRHPVEKITIAGGFAKMVKLAQGLLDLHSKRGSVDFAFLSRLAETAGADADFLARILQAASAGEVLEAARKEGIPLPHIVAAEAWRVAARALSPAPLALEIALFDRAGILIGHAPFTRVA